jgi:hypothetical protein
MTNPFTIQHGGRIFFTRACLWLAACACAASVGAQDTASTSGPQERRTTGDTEVAAPAQPGRLSRTVSWAETKLDGLTQERDGLYPEIGGMIAGGGLSIGPGYRRHLFGDRAIIDASAARSWNGYTMMRSQLAWPQLWNERLSVGGQVKYQDFTQVNFFGVGSGSLKNDQTDYRLRDVDALGFATVRANSWLSFTGRTGLLRRLEIGSGTSTLVPSTETRFDEMSAPGLTQQPSYLHADVAVDADTLDVQEYPSSGGRYRLSMAMFHDQDFARYSFRRIEADAAQYIPLGRTVLAFRGRMDFSQTAAGQDVPFYLLPTLGGSNSLRGFLDYRFRDRNLLLLGAEYRWPMLRNIDAALFYDAGNVAPTANALSGSMNTDYGAGLRLHSARHMLVRLDVARSREGTRALLTLSAPLARPNRTVAPYVP